MRLISAVFLALSLVACATDQPAKSTASLGHDAQFHIPAWAPPERPIEALQRITSRFQDDTLFMQAQISVNEHRLLMVGLDPLGNRLFTIVWNADGITLSRQGWLPESVDPTIIVASIVFCYWPSHVIRSAINGQSLDLDEGPEQRRLIRGGETVLQVSYETDRRHAWNERIDLLNVSFGFRLTIDSREIE